MKDLLNSLVQAMGDQAIALGTMADQLTSLKQTLARQFPDMADELKSQIQTDHEKSRTAVYELQVSLGKLREAITQLPDAPQVEENPVPARRKAEAKASAKPSKA